MGKVDLSWAIEAGYGERELKILEFELDPDNIENCDDCPYNHHVDNHYSFSRSHPCGQPHCWVALNCIK